MTRLPNHLPNVNTRVLDVATEMPWSCTIPNLGTLLRCCMSRLASHVCGTSPPTTIARMYCASEARDVALWRFADVCNYSHAILQLRLQRKCRAKEEEEAYKSRLLGWRLPPHSVVHHYSLTNREFALYQHEVSSCRYSGPRASCSCADPVQQPDKPVPCLRSRYYNYLSKLLIASLCASRLPPAPWDAPTRLTITVRASLTDDIS